MHRHGALGLLELTHALPDSRQPGARVEFTDRKIEHHDRHPVVQLNALVVGPDGKPVTYKADAYVLAASPIEDARLLFLSGNLGNSSGMVGKNQPTALLGVIAFLGPKK